MSDVILKIHNTKYTGWTSVNINKSVMNIAGTLGFSGTDIFPGKPRDWDVVTGDACSVEIDGQTVITGYIEDISITYDKTNHNIQLGGRSKTADLVDCSWIDTVNEWKNTTVSAIVTALCLPFGITVLIDSSVGGLSSEKIESFKTNEGDTVIETITRLGRTNAFLPVDYGNGDLTLTQVGTETVKDTLELGVNVISGSSEQSEKDRFRTYIVKGSGTGGDNKSKLKFFTAPAATVTDSIITRYRPIVIFPETSISVGACLKRAKWEKNVRAGKSRTIQYTVQGWTQSDGNPWPINKLVRVKDSFLALDTVWLVAAVTFTKDDNGTQTLIDLIDPNALTVLEEEIKSGFNWVR